MKKLGILCLLLLGFLSSNGSHLIGGNLSYIRWSHNSYRITVTYYRDCLPPNLGGGNPTAFVNDNPINVSIYSGDSTFIRTVEIEKKRENIINPFGTPLCVSEPPMQCANKAVFEQDITLPPSTNGYIFINQRCCLNENVLNIENSKDMGHTLMTKINDPLLENRSAVFREDIGPVLCVNYEQTLEVSATDADQDSLSYSLCSILNGGSPSNPKPNLTSFPNLYKINYKAAYDFLNPIPVAKTSDFTLDAQTGILTIKPNQIGHFLVGICCTEWRNGIAIQNNVKYFAIRVADCKPRVDIHVSEDIITPYGCIQKPYAKGADFYRWHIRPEGQDLIYLDDSTLSNPTISYNPNAFKKYGKLQLTIEGTDINGCIDKDSINLTITKKAQFFIPNAFSPNGDGLNDYLRIHSSGNEFEFIRIFNRWGNKVFESNSIYNEWDGTYQGSKVDLGTYFWVARIRDKQGNRVTNKGTVVIVK